MEETKKGKDDSGQDDQSFTLPKHFVVEVGHKHHNTWHEAMANPLPVLCSICVHVHACICFSLSVSPVPSLSLSVSLLCVSAQFISTVLIPPRVVLAMQRSGASSASRSRESLHGDEDEDNGRDDAAHAATYHTLTITKGANGFGFRLAGAVHGCAASTTIASHVAVMVLRVCVCATHC